MRTLLLVFITSIILYSCSNKGDHTAETTPIDQDQFIIQKADDSSKYERQWTNGFADGKTGIPFISNFKIPDNYDKQNWSITSDNKNVMFFTNRKGILSFDSKEWSLIKTPTFPYLFFKDKDRIYVGCSNAYGYLAKDDDGKYNFIKLSTDTVFVGEISSITKAYDKIIFASEKTLSIYEPKSKEQNISYIDAENDYFTGIFVLRNELYVSTATKGLLKMANNSLVTFEQKGWSPVMPLDKSVVTPLKKTFTLKNQDIIFSIPFNNEYILLGTDDNALYLFDGNGFAEYKLKNASYLEENVITGGVDLSSNEFAISTLTKGSIIIEKPSGNILSVVNFQTGLPDDEIYAIGADRNMGLWMAHQFGVSRVNYALPIKNYSNYMGLQGNIISLIDYNNAVYVSTSEGLFYLSKVENYKEIEVFVKKKRVEREKNNLLNRRFAEKEVVNKTDNTTNIIDKTEVKKKNWFKKRWNKIQQKINKKDELPLPVNTTESDKIVKKENKKTTQDIVKKKQPNYEEITVSEKKYALQSVEYIYKKLHAINAKCGQIRKFGNSLLVASNIGLFEVKDTAVTLVIKDRYINTMHVSDTVGGVLVGTDEGILEIKQSNGKWEVRNPIQSQEFSYPIFSIAEVEPGKEYWLGSENRAYRLTFDSKGKDKFTGYHFHNEYSEKIIVQNYKGELKFFLSSGIFTYNKENDIVHKLMLFPDFIPNPIYVFSHDSIAWLVKNKNIISLPEKDSLDRQFSPFFELFDNVQEIYVDSLSNFWIVDNYNSIYKISNTRKKILYDFDLFIKEITDVESTPYSLDNLKLSYKNNSLYIDLSAPSYLKSNTTYFQYNVDGLKDDWSSWELKSRLNFPYIPPGDYTFNVRAKNVLGQISDTQSIHFVIKHPFWLTWWFILLCVATGISIILFFVRINQKRLQLENARLEEKIQERTAELLKQKEHIIDSIFYASRIQKAMLPPKEQAVRYFPQHFILNMPREIVSGDYYWFTHRDNKTVVAAADCTGHGVPGAFLSMLGITFLDDIVNKQKIENANEILNCLRSNVMRALRQTGKRGESKDGMDIALCIVDEKNRKLEYAGAHNPLWLFRKRTQEQLEAAKENGDNDLYELNEYKADRMPIGIYLKNRSFKNHIIDLQPGDTFYIFSDGYADQFGEKSNRKFYVKKFKKLLLSIQDKPMVVQRSILLETILEWKGRIDQVDDILVIGIRIPE